MKRIMMILLALLIMSGVAMAEYPELKCGGTPELVGEIAASGTASYVIEFQRKDGYAGFFSIQPIFTGDGTLQIQYARSNNGTDYATAVELTAGATSGVFYEPAVATSFFSGYIKIIFNETGNSDSVTVTDPGLCRQ